MFHNKPTTMMETFQSTHFKKMNYNCFVSVPWDMKSVLLMISPSLSQSCNDSHICSTRPTCFNSTATRCTGINRIEKKMLIKLNSQKHLLQFNNPLTLKRRGSKIRHVSAKKDDNTNTSLHPKCLFIKTLTVVWVVHTVWILIKLPTFGSAIISGSFI